MVQSDLYLNKTQLKAALERCLNCAHKPCAKACPVGCDPQAFIQAAQQKDNQKATQIIQKNNPLGEICGLICPHQFCVKSCTRSHIDFAIPIPKIQATLMAQRRLANNKLNIPNGCIMNQHSDNQNETGTSVSHQKIAVVGSGPAGLGATFKLLQKGFQVHLFEASDKMGGALNLIPPERLPKEVIQFETVDLINHPHCFVHLQTPIQKPKDLLSDFVGVIWAIGEPRTTRPPIMGGELTISFRDYLQAPQKYGSAKRIAIIGGGNVALDCALTAHRLGAEQVEMFVRRRLCDMRISDEDFLLLKQNEINVSPLTCLTAIQIENNQYTLSVCKNQYQNGLLKNIPHTGIKLSGFDLIIAAIGSLSSAQTEQDNIICAGDCKTGSSTAVEAIKSGFEAAEKLVLNILK